MPNRRGLILDLTVMLTSLFLVGPLTRLVRRSGEALTNDANTTPALGLLLAAIFPSYTPGAYLKAGIGVIQGLFILELATEEQYRVSTNPHEIARNPVTHTPCRFV